MVSIRVATTVLAALTTLAVATPVLENRGGGSSCSTGSLQCCESVQKADSPGVQTLAGALGIPIGSITGEVGLQCSPITIIGGLNGNNCKANAICCTDNDYGGGLSFGCLPVSLE